MVNDMDYVHQYLNGDLPSQIDLFHDEIEVVINGMQQFRVDFPDIRQIEAEINALREQGIREHERNSMFMPSVPPGRCR